MTIFSLSSVETIEIFTYKNYLNFSISPKSNKWRYKNYRFSIRDLVYNIKHDIYRKSSDCRDLLKNTTF